MKKLLIATTALVATAGAAAADISVSGDGRMGFVYDGDDTKLSSRIRINFSASGETDSGLAFGGSTRADNSGSAASGFAGSIFISGAFGKLSMGDVDGAAKAAVGQVSGIGYTGIGDPNELFFLHSGSDVDGDGTDNTLYPVPSALYEYAMGATTFYAGIGQIGGYEVAGFPALSAGQSYSVGVKWASDNGLVLSGGYEATEDLLGTSNASNIALGADWTGGAWTFKGRYMTGDYGDAIGDVDQYAVSADWTSGATTVTGFYSVVDPAGAGDRTSYGLGAAYDLGGGATFAGGVANVDHFDGSSDTIGDLGLKFSF